LSLDFPFKPEHQTCLLAFADYPMKDRLVHFSSEKTSTNHHCFTNASKICYHIRTGRHGLTEHNWHRCLDSADKHWKDK